MSCSSETAEDLEFSTDSACRDADWELMNWLTDFLVEKWGEGGRTKTKWKMTAHEVE